MEAKLAGTETYRDGTNIARLKRDYAKLKQRVEELYESWESHRLLLDELLEPLKND